MSLWTMCDEGESGARLSEEWTRQTKRPIYLRETFAGCVLSLREMNGYDDSDFYALVWDADQHAFREIMYATTRGWTYPNGAVVDATPEVLARWEQYVAGAQALHRYWEEGQPRKGRRVRILPNRGKAKAHAGREGVIFWMQEQRSQFGTWSYGLRLGVEIDGGARVFLMADKAEVIRT